MNAQQRKRLDYYEAYQSEMSRKAAMYVLQMQVESESRRRTCDKDTLDLALVYSQKSLLTSSTEQFLLDESALKMCEALRFTSNILLDTPDHPLWLQFMAPRFFREREIIAVYFYSPYSVKTLQNNRSRGQMSPLVCQETQRRRLQLEHEWYVEIISSGPVPEHMKQFAESNTAYNASAHILGLYHTDLGTWRMSTSHQCPTATCCTEMLGEREVVIGCPSCVQELEEWSRWLATMLDLLAGKFRRPDGRRNTDEEFRQTVDRTITELKGAKLIESNKKAHVTARVVRYDISYFHSTVYTRKGTLRDSHTILTADQIAEYGDWSSLSVNTRVLVEDFTEVAWHTRYFTHKRFKVKQTQVKPKKKRRQLITLALWRKREEARARAKEQELERRTRLITAKAFEA